jgi:TIR domain
VPYKPFLSHTREESHELALLRDELILRGAGGWQDVDELRLGQRWKAAFGRAIGRETGGFIWWATPATLKSETICRIEVRFALRRARSRRGGAYPVVPLFVGLRPGADADAIKQAFGRRRGKQLLEL